MTNRFGTTDDWVDGDILYAADNIDSIDNVRFCPITKLVNTNPFVGTVGFSATNYSGVLAAGTIYTTTDSGTTWATKSTGIDTAAFMVRCKATPANAFAIEANVAASEAAITTDSGVTWSDTDTDPSWGAEVYDVSYPVAGLIVVAGDDAGGGKHVVFSTNAGANWTDTTTAIGGAVYAVEMFSATVGYLLDASNNIWKTTDGAANWNNTTFDSAGSAIAWASMLAISATKVVLFSGANSLELYTDTVGCVRISSQAGDRCLGMWMTSLGTVYVLTATTNLTNRFLYRSDDVGVTWTMAIIPGTSTAAAAADETSKHTMTEIGTTGHLITSMVQTNMVRINVS